MLAPSSMRMDRDFSYTAWDGLADGRMADALATLSQSFFSPEVLLVRDRLFRADPQDRVQIQA